MGVQGKTLGTMFSPVPVETLFWDPERVGGTTLCIFLIVIHTRTVIMHLINSGL